MRISFEVNDSTEVYKVIFYKKDADVTPVALKNFEYMYEKLSQN